MKTIEINIALYDWNVNLYFSMTCKHLSILNDELRKIECPKELVEKANNEFGLCKDDIGMTYSNHSSRQTLIVIGKTKTKELFINTLAHEIYHFIDLLSMVNNIEDHELKAILTGTFTMLLTEIISDTLKEFK